MQSDSVPVAGNRPEETAGNTSPRINVTLSNTSVYPRRADFAFEAAKQLGFDGLEVLVWQDKATQHPQRLTVLEDRYDTQVLSMHAPTLLVSQTVWGRSPMVKLDRAVELAEQVGARTVVAHPPFFFQRRYARQFEEQVAQLHGRSGVILSVENMYPWRTGVRDFAAYLPGWDPAAHKYAHVTLDISHAATARQNSLELMHRFGNRLTHVHMTDGNGSGHDEHLVPGRGSQPCAEVLRELASSGWEGDVVVEIGTRSLKDDDSKIEALAESLAFCRRHLGSATRQPATA